MPPIRLQISTRQTLAPTPEKLYGVLLVNRHVNPIATVVKQRARIFQPHTCIVELFRPKRLTKDRANAQPSTQNLALVLWFLALNMHSRHGLGRAMLHFWIWTEDGGQEHVSEQLGGICRSTWRTPLYWWALFMQPPRKFDRGDGSQKYRQRKWLSTSSEVSGEFSPSSRRLFYWISGRLLSVQGRKSKTLFILRTFKLPIWSSPKYIAQPWSAVMRSSKRYKVGSRDDFCHSESSYSNEASCI